MFFLFVIIFGASVLNKGVVASYQVTMTPHRKAVVTEFTPLTFTCNAPGNATILTWMKGSSVAVTLILRPDGSCRLYTQPADLSLYSFTCGTSNFTWTILNVTRNQAGDTWSCSVMVPDEFAEYAYYTSEQTEIVVQAPPPACEDGWVSFNRSCYIAIQKFEPWFLAMELCKALSGYLVQLESPEENRFIQNYVRGLHSNHNIDYRYWIGAHDLAVEGHWTWAFTHDRIQYFDWAPGEPNSLGGDQDCMEIQSVQGYHWDDNACDAKLYAVCEYSPHPTVYGSGGSGPGTVVGR